MTQSANWPATNGDGAEVRGKLNENDLANATDHKGPTPPGYAASAGFTWLDDSADPVWTLRVYTGGIVSNLANWPAVWSFDRTSKVFSLTGSAALGASVASWHTSYKAMHLGSAENFIAGINATGMLVGCNCYYDGTNWRRISAAAASLITTTSDSITFSGAANGAAGSVATLNETARFDTVSQVFLLGVQASFTSPNAAKFQIVTSNTGGHVAMRNSGATAGKYMRLFVEATNNLTIYNNANVGVYLADGATSWTANSDERLKVKVRDIAGASEKIAGWRTWVGRYLADDEEVERLFLVAQDVQASFPQAVDVGDDEDQTLGLRYLDIIPVLVRAHQEHISEIADLKARLAAAGIA